MRRSFSENSYVHVIKRGVRGLPIVKNDHDKWRFVRMLRYLNDDYRHINWHRQVKNAGAEGRQLPWPDGWPNQKPLVRLHAYTLMPNHFHLLVEENTENGIAKFMKKIGESMTKYYNRKYDTKGSLFQGPYKSSVIDDDQYLRFVVAYILVKNPFEVHPDGFSKAVSSFDKALDWTYSYPFCSLVGSFRGSDQYPEINSNLISELFADEEDFKKVAKDALRHMEAQKTKRGVLE